MPKLVFGDRPFIFLWLVKIIARIDSFQKEFYKFSFFIVFSSIIFSLYGTWNAFNVNIEEIDVELINLPENWKDKKIVQLSDLHLGKINRVWRLNQIVKMTNDLNPDVIAITGDLFDGVDGNLEIFVNGLTKLEASVGIYYVTGNHEYYVGESEVLDLIRETKIKHLNNEYLNIDGLQIAGIDYTINNKEIDYAKEINSWDNFSKDTPSILLHYIPEKLDDFEKAGIDLILLGHTHKGQMFPFGFINKKIFDGYNYGLNKYKNMLVQTTSGAGTWGPPMRTSNTNEIVLINLN